VKPEETLGEFIYDLGNRQWDISKLRELLEEILPQNTRFEGFEVEHDFESIGKKVMLLNARRIKRESKGTELILLAIEDITDRKRAEQERIQKEKLEAILEMAGAVCHELNQPLQVVSVSLEPLLRAISKDSPLYNRTQKIEEKIDMIAGITRKLQTMTKYETKDYIEGRKIIDIDKTSS
jgi:signal transduction histidine kinase